MAHAHRHSRLNLDSIQAHLESIRENFDYINSKIDDPRDPFTEQILNNMMAAFSYLDYMLEKGLPILERDTYRHLLELNHRVLCGTDKAIRREYASHLLETEKKFYKRIKKIHAWYHAQKKRYPTERLAAGVYIGGLAMPQLFIEGNHRTNSLIASQVLVTGGKHPFVMTLDNAIDFLNCSADVKYNKRKKKLMSRWWKVRSNEAIFTRILSEYACGKCVVEK